MPLETTLVLLEKSQIQLGTLGFYNFIFFVLWSLTLAERTEPT
ncbi:hypothetical protein V6Z12_A11G115800 [Gossypium hirsutum]